MGALLRLILFAVSMVGIGGAVAGDETTTNNVTNEKWEWWQWALLIIGILSGIGLLYWLYKKYMK